jgi:hypothetical protein
VFTEGKVIYRVLISPQYQPAEGTPFTGYYEKMYQFIKTRGDEMDFDRFCDYILHDCADFNPTKQLDNQGRPCGPILHPNQQGAIQKYLENLIYSFYAHNKAFYTKQAFQKRYQEIRVITDDEDQEISESELLEEEHILDSIDIERMRSRLPVLLKSLHDFGKSIGYSVISCVSAMQNSGFGKKKYQWSDIGDYHIWNMNKTTGKCIQVIHKQNDNMKYLLKWLSGQDPYNIAYRDLQDFIYILITLNIDIRNIDPREYDQDYIDTLVSDYITPNSELVSRNVWASFKPNNLLSSSVRSIINNTSLSAYLRADFNLEDQIKKVELNSMEQFILACNNTSFTDAPYSQEMYSMYMNYGLIPKELPLWSDDGYLMSHSGAIKLIDVSNLYKPQPGNPKRVAIMHKSGYLFLYKENKLLEEYLSPEWARQYMASRLRGSIQSSSGAIKDWGVWLIWK